MNNLDQFEGCLVNVHDKYYLGTQNINGNLSLSSFSRQAEANFIKNFKITEVPNSSFSREKLPEILNKNLYSDRFCSDFERAKYLIEKTSLEKIVVFNTLKLEFKDNLKVNNFLIKNSNVISDNHYYAYWKDNSGTIGLSPELVFNREEKAYFTYAIAGTNKELLSLEQTDSKLLEEHNLVIDDISNKLKGLNLHFEVQKTNWKRFKSYYHLVTPIKILESSLGDDFIKDFVPTAALGGYPINDFKKHREDLEFEKKLSFLNYGGVFHFNSSNFQKSIVIIRSIEWENNIAYIHAGCGVVSKSVLSEELAESLMKIDSVLEVFCNEL